MTETDVRALVEELARELEATAERPVERTASRWIGEAEAVAAGIVGPDVEMAVIEERIGHVDRLLSEVETTGDPTADEHVDAATQLVERILQKLDD